MHFDCVQAHSGQMLMPAVHFSLGAAAAGLLPAEDMLTYPKDSAYGTHLAVCSEAMLGRRPRFKQALAVFLRET